MSDTHLVYPTVHLNGTSKEELKKQCEEAWRAIFDAEKEVAGMAPHMRDYYVQEDSATVFRLAQSQHLAMLRKLQEIKTDIEEIWKNIDNQGEVK